MEKKLTLSVSRDWKECFDNDDLKELSSALEEALGGEQSISIISQTNDDSEELIIIVGNK